MPSQALELKLISKQHMSRFNTYAFLMMMMMMKMMLEAFRLISTDRVHIFVHVLSNPFLAELEIQAFSILLYTLITSETF